jgi:prepilin-type N-terminal cleavage/methylation domain-containing protein
MTRERHLRCGRAGFTLVESMIAVALLGILFLAVAQTSSRASDAFDEGSAEHALSTATHRCAERIARAIEFSNASIFAGLPAGTLAFDSVEFMTPASFEGGAVLWEPREITTELEGEELDDGLDNDGDGLVDERRVVLLEAAGTPEERRVVLASGVSELFEGELANNADDNGNGLNDEPGLAFSADGDVVFVRLCCQRRDEGGRLLTKTAVTAVRPYN